MKRERNLQEAEEEEAHDLHRDREKTVKKAEMDNGTEEESERSAADKPIIQEPADLSHNNTRIPPHHHHHHDNEDNYPDSIPSGSSSEKNTPSSEDPNLQKQEDEYENPEMDEAAAERESDDVQESNQEHGKEEEEGDRDENHISYVRLPQDFPVSIPGGRPKLDSSVLNDQWVLSVKNPLSLKDSNLHQFKGSVQEPGENEGHEEASSKKKKQLNEYQKALFYAEDEQFESDMLLETLRSTIECFEQVHQNILENKINVKEGEEFETEQHFRVPHLRWIERLYGKHGLEALEALRRNPSVAVPAMLKRLRKKQNELEEDRSELKKVWAQVYAENHHNSLIHPSYFDA